MGIKNMQLTFDNPHNIYVAGQTLSGCILINLDSAKEFRKITVIIGGEGHTKWRENHGQSGSSTYTGREKYFEHKIDVFGISGDVEELPSGSHIFQFATTLPYGLPSSFEGKYGIIRYTAKVIFDCPWRFNRDIKGSFNVLSYVDLNSNPYLKEPVIIESNKHFCCLWCKSGPVTMVVRLPISGFVCGQIIPIIVELDNASNINIQKIECELQKNIVYRAARTKRKKKESISLSKLIFEGPIGQNYSRTWSEQITVPATPSSSQGESKFITVSYLLVIRAKPEQKTHLNLKTELPITIGTVPLRYSNKESESFPMPLLVTAAPSAPVLEMETFGIHP
ncbi:arrestin domain-containing protein 17-like [Periplaneta americana]|uniref:arrestin domain-containing protein 17-like n=1 Tax=Periplaneta americana TaxID=6978 RepID=UPI0037E7B6F1